MIVIFKFLIILIIIIYWILSSLYKKYINTNRFKKYLNIYYEYMYTYVCYLEHYMLFILFKCGVIFYEASFIISDNDQARILA